MNLYKLADKFRATLPSWLWDAIRKPANAILGPLNFSLTTGHLRSSFKSRAVDRRGDPIPWLTYPAIEFLDRADLSRCSVIEFGSGQSTLWFMHRTRCLVSFENDPVWYKEVESLVGPHAVISFLHDSRPCPSSPESADIILVDGCSRLKRAQEATWLLKRGGAMIVDNTDSHPEIKTLLEVAGWQHIDFWGFSPGNHVPHCTSIYFRDRCFLFD